MCSTNIPTSSGISALSNYLYNNLFLPGFSSSPGWLLVTRTRGAWWCRYRGHCRSGPRHLSPRSRVCAQEWHGKDIHTHTSIPIHPCTLLKQRAKPSTHQTSCLPFLVLFLSSVVVGDGQEARHQLLMTAPRLRPSRLGQYWQKIFVDVFNKYSNIARQQSTF